MAECELIKKCCFYLKFQGKHAIVWQDLIGDYCLGVKSDLCARKIHFHATQNCAPDNVTPFGELPEAFLDIG
jgi:hypothetical protein